MMISISRRSEFIQKVTELLKKHRSEGTMYLFSVDFAEFKLINYIYGRYAFAECGRLCSEDSGVHLL